MPASRGSLTVVGLGIEVPGHVTAQALASVERADVVLYLVADTVAAQWIQTVNARSRSLHGLYEAGRPRRETYDAIVATILEPIRQGNDVCAAIYGHPGVFANASHEAIEQARDEGFAARMLPGISADACLFADLGVDPSAAGCQSFEATDLLLYRRSIDPTVALVVWQAGAVGNLDYAPDGDTSRLWVLANYLLERYAPEHPVVLYQASLYAVCGPMVQTIALATLAAADVSPMTTLYIEPVPAEPASEMVELLGLAEPNVAVPAERAATTLPLSS